MVSEAGYKLERLSVTGFGSKLSFDLLKSSSKMLVSFFSAYKLLKKYQPKILIGMGGYASFPLIFVANWFGYPTIIHEQNAVPGRANIFLAKRANLIASGFPLSKDYFGNKEVIFIGNPVRSQVLSSSRRQSLKYLGIKEKRFTVVVFGGSRGAKKINQAIVSAYHLFANNSNLRFIHITGRMNYEPVKEQLKKQQDISDKVDYRLYSYVPEIWHVYALADLIVCRAGASTLAEISALGIPSILIPYPYATNNHQAKNAQWYVEKGAAQIILDENLSGSLLWQSIYSLIHHPTKLKEMSDRAKSFRHDQAAKRLAEQVICLMES